MNKPNADTPSKEDQKPRAWASNAHPPAERWPPASSHLRGMREVALGDGMWVFECFRCGVEVEDFGRH